MTRDQRRRSEDAQVPQRAARHKDTRPQLAQLDDRARTGAGAVKERARLAFGPRERVPQRCQGVRSRRRPVFKTRFSVRFGNLPKRTYLLTTEEAVSALINKWDCRRY